METVLVKRMSFDEVPLRYMMTLPEDCYFVVDGDRHVVELYQFRDKGDEWLWQ